MKSTLRFLLVALLGVGLIASIALLANRFEHHPLFAPLVYGAIVVLLGVFYGLHRRAKHQTNSDRGG